MEHSKQSLIHNLEQLVNIDNFLVDNYDLYTKSVYNIQKAILICEEENNFIKLEENKKELIRYQQQKEDSFLRLTDFWKMKEQFEKNSIKKELGSEERHILSIEEIENKANNILEYINNLIILKNNFLRTNKVGKEVTKISIKNTEKIKEEFEIFIFNLIEKTKQLKQIEENTLSETTTNDFFNVDEKIDTYFASLKNIKKNTILK
jgi:hypothetical protein